MGVTFTYEKMRQEESSLEDDQRTISDARIYANEESHAPKRRKGMPGESKTKRKEIVNN